MGAWLFAAGSVHADDDLRPRTWLSYGEPQESYYVRAALEVSAIWVLGEVQYQSERTNSTDWDLKYDWPDFRKKLTGEAVRFDSNRFDTNMITHPTAGLAYYVAARGNRLNVLESFLYATAASTLWEYVGEPKEKASVNDLVVTPLSGAAFGEAFFELGVFFERSKKTPVTTALAWLLAPTKEVHDWVDDAHAYRSSDRDDIGLTREIAHRFAFEAGAGFTAQGSSPAEADARLGLHTRLLAVPHHDAPGRATMFLPAAPYSSIDLESTLGREGLDDLQLDVLVAPVGLYVKRLERERGELAGQRMFLGATAGFDYGLHRYDRSNPDEMDQVSGVHLGGMVLDHDWFAPPVRVHTTLQMRGELAAVRAIAIDAYFRAHGADVSSLPTVTREEAYYFATEAVVAPGVEAFVGPLWLGASARYESFWSIDTLDRYQEEIRQPQAPMHDRRTSSRAWIGVMPTEWLAARVGVDHRTRTGEVDLVSARREETSLWTSVGAVF